MLENERFLRNYPLGLNICRHCEMNALQKGSTRINKIHSASGKLSGSLYYSLTFHSLLPNVLVKEEVYMYELELNVGY